MEKALAKKDELLAEKDTIIRALRERRPESRTSGRDSPTADDTKSAGKKSESEIGDVPLRP
jgi:hypothetical protein